MLKKDNSKFKSVFYSFIILILCIFSGYGMFIFIQSLGLSKTISLAASIVFFIGAISLLIIVRILTNRTNGKKNIIKIIIAICLIVITINIGLIAFSPYFKANNTTTANNNYYINSFTYSYLIDNYTQDKTVYVSKSNTFIHEDTDMITPLDKSNQLALFSSVKSVEVLDGLQDATYEQVKYILSIKNQFEIANQQYACTKNAFFYTGMSIDSFDEVVILQDMNFDTYFMPYEFYKTIENMR